MTACIAGTGRATAPPPGARRRRRGFTLLETIAAGVVLAVAIPPMVWAIRGAQARRVNSVLASRARWLAVSKLEEIIADRHSSSGARGYAYLVPGSYPAEPEGTIDGSPQFARSVALAESGPPPAFASGAGYMQVRITVEWTDAGGTARSMAVSTILTEYTP